MRIINADALKKELCDKYSHIGQRIKISPVFRLVRDAPTIDAVEVVRCKDCKFRYGNACDWADFWLKDDDFCSKGKRKDNESLQ